MWEPIKRSFEESLRRVATAIAAFLPRLAALAAVLLLTLVLALLVRAIIRRLLDSVRFDEHLRRWGLAPAANDSPRGQVGLWLARAAFWLVLVAGFLLGLTVFDATAASSIALQVLGYLPQIVAAAAIFAVGLWAARYLERNVLISAVNRQIQSARLLSLGVKWLVAILASAMALQHLSIGGPLLIIAFSILFGGIVLALALAVGLGSREIVGRTLERQIQKERERQREIEDDVRHL
jgi:hypothetical protein